MRELLDIVDAWQATGRGFGRAVTICTFNSSPRDAGAVLLAADDGSIAGSVSGGCVEGAAADEVRRARRDGRARVIRYGISDEVAWDVGLACGGTIDVLVQPEVPPAVIEAAAAGDESQVLVTALPADAPGPDLAPHATGAGEPPAAPIVVTDADPSDAGLSPEVAAAARAALVDGASRTIAVEGDQWFIEAFAPPPRLVVVGAVHIAIPLVRYAHELGYRTVVIDRRATFATGERFGEADELLVEWPEGGFERIVLRPTDAVAILSHDPKLDEPAIVEALRRGCRYVGAIGSRKTQAERRERLLAGGVSADELARLHGPIGLDLGGRTPAEIALAIVAEVVAERRGGSRTPRAAG
jgi:xanthine dehydrogenase accessory factor